jgi:hypothetical protein
VRLVKRVWTVVVMCVWLLWVLSRSGRIPWKNPGFLALFL